MFAAIRRASSRVMSLVVGVPGLILHDKAGIRFLDCPRRREAASSH
jgi:hypothetical protein